MTDTLARGSREDDPDGAASPPVRWTKCSRRKRLLAQAKRRLVGSSTRPAPWSWSGAHLLNFPPGVTTLWPTALGVFICGVGGSRAPTVCRLQRHMVPLRILIRLDASGVAAGDVT